MELGLHAGAGTLTVSDDVFGADYKEALVHQVVTAYMSAARSGTKAQKSRSDVRGGGAKPWRQKGTGRARAGTSRSPIWRSGGVSFAATPRNYEQKVNRKMYRAAIRSILSQLLREERLVVVSEFKLESPKTKGLVSQLKGMDLTDVVIVDAQPDENLYLAARNVYKVDVRDINDIDPVGLLAYEKVLMTSAAIEKLEERLK